MPSRNEVMALRLLDDALMLSQLLPLRGAAGSLAGCTCWETNDETISSSSCCTTLRATPSSWALLLWLPAGDVDERLGILEEGDAGDCWPLRGIMAAVEAEQERQTVGTLKTGSQSSESHDSGVEDAVGHHRSIRECSMLPVGAAQR